MPGTDVFHGLIIGALIGVGILLIAWLLVFIPQAWAEYRRRRAARIEAELDATAEELQRTILSLADAIATERLAVDSAHREMQHITQVLRSD